MLRDTASEITTLRTERDAARVECERLRGALTNASQAVQAFLDMVNIIQKWQALPIPAILETAQHNCPIILDQARAALEPVT